MASYTKTSKKTGAVLWIAQGFLALLFLFAGGVKLAMPIAALAQQSSMPGPFMKFIGVAEVFGAIGLILPGLLRIRTELTSIAAAGLVIIMIGATTTTAATLGVGPSLFPLIVGVLSSFVGYGRWRLVPIAPAATTRALHAAA